MDMHESRIAVIRSILGAWQDEGPDKQAAMVAAYVADVVRLYDELIPKTGGST